MKDAPVPSSTIITSHRNADLDALASMVAASYLYPGAVLVNPGLLARPQSNKFIDNIPVEFGFKQAKDCDLKAVKRLVLVDTRQRSRIPHVEVALSNPGLEVHLYDHHPNSDDDLQASLSVVRPYGSCTALLVEIIREKNSRLDTKTATLLALGLYEDTGSFSFSSTTEQDFLAGAWLATQGMDFGIISTATSGSLSRKQLTTLNELLNSAQWHNIKGVPVLIADVVMENYLDDFASLAQKVLELESAKVLFALAQMGDKIYLVGRSSMPEVDVGTVCREFGGGGHSYAASASISLTSLPEVKEHLLSVLLDKVHSKKTIRNLMTAPVLSIDIKSNLGVAEEIMGRYGLKAAPVVDYENTPGKPLGIIDYQTAVRAKAHKLEHLMVEEYMQRRIASVTPSDDLDTALAIMLNHRQRLVPVIENERMIGVISRTDIINTLVEEPEQENGETNPYNRERNLSENLKERIPKKILHLLQLAGELGDQLGVTVYAVGGFVRDLLMGNPNHDIDLSIEGDGTVFAQALAERLGGKIKVHQKFKTAVVTCQKENGEDGENKIDVASARLEYYESPAALPIVEHSSIRMDLYRRDFTINAAAIELNKANFGKLIDFYGTKRDIKDRLIRVIHSLSFIEDPTRIIRAIRFATRFDFRIGVQADRLIRNSIQLALLEKLSGHRILQELKLILEEKDPLACFRRLEEYAVFCGIHPSLHFNKVRENLLMALLQTAQGYKMLYLDPKLDISMLYLLGMLHGLKYPEVVDVLQRLSVPQKFRQNFLKIREESKEAKRRLREWAKMLTPQPGATGEKSSLSRLNRILTKLPLDGIIYLLAQEKNEQIRQAISCYFTKIRHEKADVNGNDLKKLGMPPGQAFRKILDALLDAKIDGLVKTKEEQLALAKTLIENH